LAKPPTTATGLGQVVDGSVSHDQITRALRGQQRGGAELWQVTKRFVRRIQDDDGVMIVDDTISEQPYSDENDIVCWHYDHTTGKVIKGINRMTALYHVPSRGLSLPVEFHLIAKTESYVDKKDGKGQAPKSDHQERVLPHDAAAGRDQPIRGFQKNRVSGT
jgi:hypothetical protein